MYRPTLATLLALALAAGLSACGSRGASSGSLASTTGATLASTTTSSGTAATTSTSRAGTAPVTTSGPRVALTARGLSVAGQVKPLLGAELQYFRIRDPQWDAARTVQLWEEALDQAQAAGVNFVTTYVPWDFHEENQGTLDFTGPRDLDRFLEACWKRGLAVGLKPGPFINAEWPNGMGSFGGVPQWWKDQNPQALARKPDGSPFSFDLLGRSAGNQPSYFSADFRAATVRWFQAVAPIVRRYVVDRPTIVVVQIDNETNFYFKSRFSSDYSADGLAQYRGWLAQKFPTVADLNARYGTAYASFADVQPPSSAPASDQEDPWVQDWFQAGKDGIADWQLFVRHAWESLGIQEPWVLFTTNDSPHAMPTMDLSLWDGQTKNKAGLASIDAYPKQFPIDQSVPLDYPFLTSFFTKRFIDSNADYSFAGQAPQKIRGGFAAELEGGLFSLPLGVSNAIPSQTTDAVLCEFYGHGGVASSIYVFRAGLNHDGTDYFTSACVDPQGNPTARYAVASKFGNGLLAAHGQELLASSDVEAPVALVVGARFDAPMHDVAGHPGWIQAKEAPGVFGWLEDAGIEPVVLDASRVQPGDLDRYKLVVYVDPDATEDSFATELDRYVRAGGNLLNLLHNGRHDGEWSSAGIGPSLLANGLFAEGTLDSIYEETLGVVLPPHVNFALPNGYQGWLTTSSFMGKYTLAASAQPFAHDRTFPFGADGEVTGWSATKGLGRVFFLGTSPGRPFRDWAYYHADPQELATARALARWLADACGIVPALEVANADARAFARVVDPAQGGGALVFLASRLASNATVTVRVLDLGALGLSPATTYSLEDVLTGASLGTATGADLQTKGLQVPLQVYGSGVVRVK